MPKKKVKFPTNRIRLFDFIPLNFLQYREPKKQAKATTKPIHPYSTIENLK